MNHPASSPQNTERLRDEVFSARLEAIEARTDGRIASLEAIIVVTAIGAVIGVAAFNATVLSNMLASFESGRNVSEARAKIQRQAEETAALLRQIQQGLPNK